MEGKATIRIGESLALLQAMPDGSVDAIVTDPPYEVALNPEVCPWDVWPGKPIWRELRRVAKRDATLAVGETGYERIFAVKQCRGGRTHPTQKPSALMAQIVRLASRAGDTVLDPFAGSGATGLAAMAEGRNVILLERDASYLAKEFSHGL